MDNRTRRERWYVRYCDDFVIVHPSRTYLLSIVEDIKYFLYNQLALRLHNDKIFVRNWGQGIDFLGYVLLPHATVLRTKTKDRMLARVTQENLSSYLGLCSHASTYNISQIIQTKVGLEHT